MSENNQSQSKRMSSAVLEGASPKSAHTLHEDIYVSLRAAVMCGELHPGQAVPMRALAERFGTSIIPVRDALRRLIAERALSILSNRTVVVPRMPRRRFQELLNVRLNVETMLARQAAERVTPAQIRLLEKINDEMRAEAVIGNVKAFLLANQRFHFALYGAAQSTVMYPIVESLWMQAGPFLNAVSTKSGIKSATDNHLGVLRALRRGDSVEVGNAIASDIADAADVVLTSHDFLEQEDDV